MFIVCPPRFLLQTVTYPKFYYLTLPPCVTNKESQYLARPEEGRRGKGVKALEEKDHGKKVVRPPEERQNTATMG